MNSKQQKVNTLLNRYLSIDNLQLIQVDLKQFVSETYNGDKKMNLRKLIFDVMNTIRADGRIQNLNLDEINIKTLKICKKIFNEQVCTRDANIFHQRKNIVNDNIPQPSTTTNDQNDLDTLINDRKSDYSTTSNEYESQQSSSSSNIFNTIDTQPIDETEFKTSLNNFINERNNFPFSIPQLSNNKPIVENFESIKLNSLDLPTTNKNDNLQDLCMDQTHPKDFFKINSDINDIMKSRVLMIPSNASTGDNKNTGDSLMNILYDDKLNNNNTSPHKIEKTKYILINSYDRDWINEPSRYKYKIRFSNSINTPVKVPYYENNPTVPFTKTDDYAGIPNKMGWTDNNGNFHSKYDKDKPLGENPLGYEEVANITDQDSNLSKFKNVTSIKVNNVTIPIENVFRHVNSYNEFNNNDFNFNFNFPYILLNIDEFNDVYDGTDNIIRKAFCQLQYDNHFVCPNGRNYVILKPVQNEQKNFYPTPLSTLPTLNLSLSKPNGQLLNNTHDTFKILAIQSEQSYYLKITLTTFFEKRSFMINDYIRFKNFNIFKINDSNVTISHYNTFNSFINRIDGHEIIQIGEPNENGFFNSFSIYAPGLFNFETGTFDLETNLTNALTEFNENVGEANDTEDIYADKFFQNGYIINMSLQHSISFTINVEELDSKIVKSIS